MKVETFFACFGEPVDPDPDPLFKKVLAGEPYLPAESSLPFELDRTSSPPYLDALGEASLLITRES